MRLYIRDMHTHLGLSHCRRRRLLNFLSGRLPRRRVVERVEECLFGRKTKTERLLLVVLIV